MEDWISSINSNMKNTTPRQFDLLKGLYFNYSLTSKKVVTTQRKLLANIKMLMYQVISVPSYWLFCTVLFEVTGNHSSTSTIVLKRKPLQSYT